MGAIDIDKIGKYNKQLVMDIAAGETDSMGYPINVPRDEGGWRHLKNYNYDLSLGIAGIGTPLKGTKVGVKYYCAMRERGRIEIDGSKRIVHICDPKDTDLPSDFYILYHSPFGNNSYSECHRIVFHPTAKQKLALTTGLAKQLK
jgi:hypothetical protein